MYGSLYPWRFAALGHPVNPLDVLLYSPVGPLNRYLAGDVLINIALYMPFGMSAFALFRRLRRPALAWIAPVLLAACLSTSMELIQVYEPARHSSWLDVVTNAIGASIGIFAAWLYEEMAAIRHSPGGKAVRTVAFVDRAALALLFCWAAYLVFPFFPVLGRTATGHKFSLFLHWGELPALAILSGAGLWFTAGRLLTAAGREPAPRWLALSLIFIPAQILIVYRQPGLADLVGATLGTLLFRLFSRRNPAIPFLLLLIARGLAPFRFGANPASFSWLPFGGFLAMDWRPGIVLLLEKLLYCGAAIWLLRAAGLRLLFAAPAVALLLAAIEAAQIWIPNRTPEITDPLLALLMGAVLAACQPRPHPAGTLPVEVLRS